MNAWEIYRKCFHVYKIWFSFFINNSLILSLPHIIIIIRVTADSHHTSNARIVVAQRRIGKNRSASPVAAALNCITQKVVIIIITCLASRHRPRQQKELTTRLLSIGIHSMQSIHANSEEKENKSIQSQMINISRTTSSSSSVLLNRRPLSFSSFKSNFGRENKI